MNKIVTFILFVLFSLSAKSQIKTVFFDAKEKVTADSTQAYSYGIYGKVTGGDLWVFKKYDIDGNLMVTGAFKNDSLTVPQGKFVYYDWIDPNKSYANESVLQKGKERYVVLSGNFENGSRQGRWTSFYENGEVKNVAFYEQGILNGEFKSFDRNGDLNESGQFLNDKKEGKWILSGGLQVVDYKDDQAVQVVKKTRRQLRKERESKQ